MSAPQGPRAAGSGSRGRGNPRGGVKSRVPRVTRGEKPNGHRPNNNATRGSDTQHCLKPPRSQGHVRNKSWKNPAPLNAAVQSHAGKIPDLRKEAWRNAAIKDSRTYKERMNDLYQTLKQKRERERKTAIKDGFLADPDRPTSLANAITPVGTCQEMCPEFERVERIVQLMVDGNEKTPSSTDSEFKVPCEELMVKRFRRSAAGYDEQLPSDIRPPSVLKKTLDYLFNTVIGGSEALANVHKFVWDRTRGIRNDFSIQQVTKTDDLKVAIDCFERIARFHILSLHQLTRLNPETGEFDHHQEREQLNNTLLSLMYYYDDSRHKLTSPNEAEFRAYCIIFEIQDQRPDLEDRAQNWPRPILKDPRVRTAMRLYAAAGNVSDEQGPLRPRTQFSIAQANTGCFWSLVQSNAVSYMMACVAEIYFNLVRRTALEAIWKAYKGKRGGPTKMEDWTLRDLTFALGFDSEYQTQTFCEEHDFELGERQDGELYIDLGSVASGNITDQNPRRKQIFSRSLVESKRLGRTLSAVINGLSAAQAQSRGFIEDASDADTASMADSESLFINGDSDEEKELQRSRSRSPQDRNVVNVDAPKLNAAATPFNPFVPANLGASSQNSFPSTTFGRPSSNPLTTQNPPSSTPTFNFSSKPATQEAFGNNETPKFDFLAAANAKKGEESKETPKAFSNKEPKTFNFFPSTGKTRATHNSMKSSPFGTVPEGAKGVFGQPPAASPTVKPSVPAQSPLNIPSSSVETTAPLQPKSVLDQPSASPAPPSFSFGTSPLFNLDAPKQNDKTEQVATSSALPDFEGKAPGTAITKPDDDVSKSAFFPTLTAPPGPTPILFAPTAQPAIPSISTQPEIFKASTALFPNFLTTETAPASPPSKPQETSAPLQPASFFPKPKNIETSLPQPPAISLTNQSQPPAQPKAQGPNILATSSSKAADNASTQARQGTQTPKQPQTNPRSLLLDKLSDALMLEDNGLLQQFIEFTVGPIITSSIAQLADEESWEEARECRAILLRKKFFRTWRANTWNLGLMRKGKERRRNFARSIRESARSPRRRPSDLSSSLTSSASGSASPPAPRQNLASTMPPPAKPSHKRQSLPASLGPQGTRSEAATGTKRKRDEAIMNANEVTPRRTKLSHRHSQTLGGSIMSAPPHRRLSHTPYKSRIDVSKVPEGSMLHNTLMKQARRLAPNVKSDTTHTDYFRLKALGIDPDTPVVPLTKKPVWKEAKLNGLATPIMLSPQHSSSIHTTTQTSAAQSAQNPAVLSNIPSAAADDDDEALFAQIRSVREALAQSEQWMNSERQSIERSMTPQRSISPTIIETTAQRRLREIRERGHTPSRSEIRLRAMGDKSLLPKGFWDGEGMGKNLVGKRKHRDEEITTPRPLSQPQSQRGFGLTAFAAIGGQGQMNGFGGRQDAEKKGAIFEDAIEL